MTVRVVRVDTECCYKSENPNIPVALGSRLGLVHLEKAGVPLSPLSRGTKIPNSFSH